MVKALSDKLTALTTKRDDVANNNRNCNNNNNNRNDDNNRNNPSTDDSSSEDEEVVSEKGGEETSTRIKKIVLCKAGDPQLDVNLPVSAPSKPDVFVRNPATTSPPLEPSDTRMHAATSISAKPPHHSRHIELKDLLVDRVPFGFYLKSYGFGTSSSILTELGQIPFCDKFPILCAIFEQWNPGCHLDVLTRDRSSHLIQWDPGAHNIWSFVETGLQEGADDTARRRDQLALSQIHHGIEYSMSGKIANAKTAKEAWDILKLSHTLSIAELQGSIESHVNRILEKTEKVKEEALKSQVNFNNAGESSQMGEGRGRDNFNNNNGGRGNFRGRGRGTFRGRGRGNFNQWRDNNFNNFNPSYQGRGGNNFGSNSVEEEEETIIKRGQIIIVFIVENLGIK
ncbi:unnamed protein product [Trifolium pratense]|uniref:Uncharacterized protein n=1 Tax=Trifolium pratense TaxID=57577 RepID=A0ACB0K2F3_TRIPR|nr:unnamed protein product [Trifolium pratense]